MTSSLVGSEMCIRDSREGGHMIVQCPPSDGPECPERGGDCQEHEVKRDCLLYTSDAADDM
eukprot:7735965-Prorocentrum_lima.AAC.1